MMGHPATRAVSSRKPSLPAADYEDKLWTWLFFSLLFHAALILAFFAVPFLPSGNRPSYPIYTVDLVGGEKIGGSNLGTEPRPSPGSKDFPKKTTVEAPPPPPEIKQEKVAKAIENRAAQTAEKEVPVKEKAAAPTPKEITKKDSTRKEATKETKSESNAEESALDRVRERLIQSAVERARSRSESTQPPSKGGEAISAGPGEGEGAAALGPGGRGGGVVKGMEFIIYQNRMLSSIKDNWAWVGQKSNLRVVVHFSIKDNGEITGLKIIQPSGDPSYDESVLRAVKKSSPLPPPPESSRKDFADVELTFRPKDLGA
jgi:colicin import membrane protein